MSAPQQIDASILCVRLAQCFTGAKKHFFTQKTAKNSVKIAELFKTIVKCQ